MATFSVSKHTDIIKRNQWYEITTKILSSDLFVSVLKRSALHLIFILPSGINGTIFSFGIFCYNEMKPNM